MSFERLAVVLRLDTAQVDDHIDFLRALLDRLAGFEHLGLCEIGTKRKTDHAAYQRSGQLIVRELNLSGINTHRLEIVRFGFLAEVLDLVWRCLCLEVGVIDVLRQVIKIRGQLIRVVNAAARALKADFVRTATATGFHFLHLENFDKEIFYAFHIVPFFIRLQALI